MEAWLFEKLNLQAQNLVLKKAVTQFWNYPAKICLVKIKDRKTKKRCEICSKLTLKTPERRHGQGVFVVNFEHFQPFFSISLVDLNK